MERLEETISHQLPPKIIKEEILKKKSRINSISLPVSRKYVSNTRASLILVGAIVVGGLLEYNCAVGNFNRLYEEYKSGIIIESTNSD